jgi:hypothetical protein
LDPWDGDTIPTLGLPARHKPDPRAVRRRALRVSAVPTADEDELVVFLGTDQDGVPLEVIGVELDDDDLLVIHPMKLRARYRDDFARVMEFQGRWEPGVARS